MAVTVAWVGNGRVTAADSTTGWTALKISGTGGGPTAAVADGQLEGSGAVTCVVSRQRVALYFDIGSGNELDFSGGGTEEGELIYTWAQFLAPALLNNRSTGGFGVFLESSTPGASQYHLWYFEGADTYAGGWRRLVLDPTETVSASAGTAINLAAVRYFGVFADVGATTARFDNLVCDAIDVGTGIRCYGTGTTDDLIGDLLTNEDTNLYGVVTRKVGVAGSQEGVEIAGVVDIGDDVGTNATTVTDVDQKLFCANPTYYDGTSVTTSVPVDSFGIRCVGNATGATSITVGKKIGTGDTAGGRNGYSISGNDNYDFFVDFDDGNVNTNLWYGTTFERLTGTLAWGTNTAHELVGCTFTGCSQFDPVGGVEIRGCNFTNLADITGTNQAALLWNASIDIKNCNFANNTIAGGNVGHDIEVTAAGTISFDGLITADAEQEVLFSAASGNLIVNNSGGANFSTTAADHTVTGTGTITVNNNIAGTFTGLKDNTEVRIYRNSDDVELAGIEDVTAGSPDDRTFLASIAAGTVVRYWLHNDQAGVPSYESIYVPSFTWPSSDFSLPIQQRLDANNAT